MKRVLLGLTICAAGLLIRHELRSRRQVEQVASETRAPAPPADERRAAAPPPNCDGVWRNGYGTEAEALWRQGRCERGFECWKNSASETICGALQPVDEGAARELDEQMGH